MSSKSKYHNRYVREDTEAVYHEEDNYLPTIRVKLPSVESFYGLPWDEAIKNIDGYGLKPEDQHFEKYRELGYYRMPSKLYTLDELVRKKLEKKDKEQIYPNELFDEIESDPIEYQEEIEWIQKQNDRAENGTFIFINGKPTWITGVHYKLLMCWKISKERKDGLPFYRDIDRRIYIFLLWAYTTKSAHFKYCLTFRNLKTLELENRFFNTRLGAEMWANEKGVPYIISDWNQNVEQIYRTVYGVVFAKRRRVGGTAHLTFFCLNITLQRPGGQMAIQALTEETAKDDVYGKNILAYWGDFWFIWKPSYSRHTASSLEFRPDNPSALGKEIKPHNGRCLPRSSKNKAFDGNEITAYVNDESGKKETGDILHEWNDTIRNTLAYGLRIHGFGAYVSTLGEFEKGGGKQFMDFCRKSIPTSCDDNGHTTTGLVTLFISALDGYDNTIDIYGHGHIEDPEEPYMNLSGEMMHLGARSIVMARRRQLELARDWKGLNNEIRNNPIQFTEAGTRAIRGDSWNNTALLREVVAELRYGTPKTRRVNFMWSDGQSLDYRPYHPGLKVIMEEDPNGSWEVSLNIAPDKRCLMLYDQSTESWGPDPQVIGTFIAGIDPFKYEERDLSTNTKRPSKAALVIKYKHDAAIDGPDKLPSEWVSNRYVVTYLKRTDTKDESCEDMLLPCIYFGALANIERQVDIVIQKWREWGFSGYIMHLVNPVTGQLEKAPGTHTSTATHEKGFGLINSHLRAHGKRECHLEQLEQIMETESFEDVTHKDLVAATELCEIGCENQYTAIVKEMRTKSTTKMTLRLY